jgi:hypothetical protein
MRFPSEPSKAHRENTNFQALLFSAALREINFRRRKLTQSRREDAEGEIRQDEGPPSEEASIFDLLLSSAGLLFGFHATRAVNPRFSALSDRNACPARDRRKTRK